MWISCKSQACSTPVTFGYNYFKLGMGLFIPKGHFEQCEGIFGSTAPDISWLRLLG